MAVTSDDERAVPCPHCDAGIGEPCLTPSGEDAAGPHARRVKAAERQAAEVERAIVEAKRRAEAEAPARIGTKRFQRVYVTCRLELEQRAGWTRLAAEQVEMMVLNMELAAALRAKGKAKPMTKGSTDQDVINPAIKAALALDAQALITARTLKLTPDTRGTSASVQDDGADLDEDRPPKEIDELAKLDELARRRKAKVGK